MATTSEPIHQLVIVGSGPAAITSAIYAGRGRLDPVVIEKKSFGGTACGISRVENYPGFTGTGSDLMSAMRAQAESFGVRLRFGEATAIRRLSSGPARFAVTVDQDETLLARAVLLALGTTPRHLGLPNEDALPVSYCATCDAPLAVGKPVIVVGGGNSAVQESFFLLRFCPKVVLLVRDGLTCDKTLSARLSAERKIEVRLDTAVTALQRQKDGGLTVTTQAGEKISAGRMFVFIGADPATAFLPKTLLDGKGFIKTDAQYMTAWPGLFSAGDCRHGAVRQIVTAAGEGAAAALAVDAFLSR